MLEGTLADEIRAEVDKWLREDVPFTIKAEIVATRAIGKLVDRIAALRSSGAGAEMRDLEADAARYRYLRDHCSCHYEMTWEQPAEWSIGWEFQQSTPDERYGTFDKWVDQDIERQAREQAECDAIDAAEDAAEALAAREGE